MFYLCISFSKNLLKNLLQTFIISTVLGIAINCIYYAVSQKVNQNTYLHTVPSIISGMLFLNIIAVIMSLPTLFLGNFSFWNNIATRLLLYFCGPALFLITIIIVKIDEPDKVIFLVASGVFLIVHTVFYFRLLKTARD